MGGIRRRSAQRPGPHYDSDGDKSQQQQRLLQLLQQQRKTTGRACSCHLSLTCEALRMTLGAHGIPYNPSSRLPTLASLDSSPSISSRQRCLEYKYTWAWGTTSSPLSRSPSHSLSARPSSTSLYSPVSALLSASAVRWLNRRHALAAVLVDVRIQRQGGDRDPLTGHDQHHLFSLVANSRCRTPQICNPAHEPRLWEDSLSSRCGLLLCSPLLISCTESLSS